ncbi:hypothetical protein MSG28_000750 [Choristoneura fumiferana]|uniref:Uncharacterized protein n=1 Tax=Choristoneura fumiferana TaxID=7141 RepID=A0ACC0K2T3_CHOFU|nr:hypothetical protein MSG28_000750 [Choristoneura fumiferana]
MRRSRGDRQPQLLKKMCKPWVPHKLNNLQKERRVDWCKFMINKFDAGEKKTVYDILTGDETWLYNYDPETKQQSTTGHIATVVLEDQRTVNSEWYVTVCAPQVLSAWFDKRPKSGTQHLLWHHDNADPHTSARTLDYCSSKNVTIRPQPPYSPDLAPCDFYLFPKIKEKLKGRAAASCYPLTLGTFIDFPLPRYPLKEREFHAPSFGDFGALNNGFQASGEGDMVEMSPGRSADCTPTSHGTFQLYEHTPARNTDTSPNCHKIVPVAIHCEVTIQTSYTRLIEHRSVMLLERFYWNNVNWAE